MNDNTTQGLQDSSVEQLAATNSPHINNTSDSYQLTSNHGNRNHDNSNAETNIFTAYLIIGIISIVSWVSFVFIIGGSQYKSCLKTKTQKKAEEQQEIGTKPVNASFRIPFLIGIFFFYIAYPLLEANYGNFLLAYAVEGLGWSKAMGANVTSLYWASYMVGRGLGIIAVKRLSPQVWLGTCCTLSVVSLLPLLLFVDIYPNVLWISSAAIGLTMSPIWATGITWTERYVKVSSGTGAIFLTASAIGEMLGPVLLSFLYKSFGIVSFVYIMFSSTCLVLVFYVILQIAGLKHGERFIKNNQQDKPEIEMPLK